MSNYNLEHLLSIYKDVNTKPIDESNYINWVNSYVEISKPDFLTILNVKSLSPIIFQKNYNLKFPEDKEGTIQDILDGIEESQKERIIEADAKVIEFAYDNFVEPIKCTYYLRFNAKLSEGRTTSLLRNVTVLTRDEDNMPHLVLGCIFDVTHLNGSQELAQIDIKNYINGKNILDENLLKLKEELVQIFKPKICLTKREKQILELISNGNTSAQIADKLNISIATVNTHRQNLIKKNNVSNTTALLNTT